MIRGPHDYKSRVLPAELRRRKIGGGMWDRTTIPFEMTELAIRRRDPPGRYLRKERRLQGAAPDFVNYSLVKEHHFVILTLPLLR